MPMVAGVDPAFARASEGAPAAAAGMPVAASAAPTAPSDFAAAVGFRSSLLASVMAAICFGSMRVNSGVYGRMRSEEHTSELQSLMRISYAVFCLKKKNTHYNHMTFDTVST